jgi:hypothetical protein
MPLESVSLDDVADADRALESGKRAVIETAVGCHTFCATGITD